MVSVVLMLVMMLMMQSNINNLLTKTWLKSFCKCADWESAKPHGLNNLFLKKNTVHFCDSGIRLIPSMTRYTLHWKSMFHCSLYTLCLRAFLSCLLWYSGHLEKQVRTRIPRNSKGRQCQIDPRLWMAG